MPLSSRILVLVDPSQQKQQALRRARFNAERRGEKPHLTVFMAVDHEIHKRMKTPPVLYRDPKWIDDTLSALTEVGIEHELGISWDDEWAEAVLAEIQRSSPDQIFVPVYEDEAGNRVLTDEIWRVLRSSNVDISLIHPRKDDREVREVVLAAIKTQDPAYAARNEKLIAQGKQIAEIYGAELHIVNAYQDQMNFPDRAKIMEMSGVPNECIHVVLDRPAEAISDVATKIKADVVLIAPARRAGVAAALRGTTINRLISKIGCDVMAVV